MLRRFGLAAMTIGLALLGTGSAPAQEPLYTPGAWEQSGDGMAGVSSALPPDPSVTPVKHTHTSDCAFDPYRHFDEARANWKHRKLSDRYYEDGADPDGDGVAGYCDFECANCWARLDFEKRIFYAYSPNMPQGKATHIAYGEGHVAEVGAEILPWVINDGEARFTRWGFTFMFSYTNWSGNLNGRLQSQLSGNFARIDDGATYSFIVGPTIRSDIEILGVRLSPNATVGMSFDWTTLDQAAPVQGDIRRLERFKFAGFDAGGYVRMMLDFPLCKTVNFGVGGEYRFVPTDVMVRNEEIRKHLGVLISISHEF